MSNLSVRDAIMWIEVDFMYRWDSYFMVHLRNKIFTFSGRNVSTILRKQHLKLNCFRWNYILICSLSYASAVSFIIQCKNCAFWKVLPTFYRCLNVLAMINVTWKSRVRWSCRQYKNLKNSIWKIPYRRQYFIKTIVIHLITK